MGGNTVICILCILFGKRLVVQRVVVQYTSTVLSRPLLARTSFCGSACTYSMALDPWPPEVCSMNTTRTAGASPTVFPCVKLSIETLLAEPG